MPITRYHPAMRSDIENAKRTSVSAYHGMAETYAGRVGAAYAESLLAYGLYARLDRQADRHQTYACKLSALDATIKMLLVNDYSFINTVTKFLELVKQRWRSTCYSEQSKGKRFNWSA